MIRRATSATRGLTRLVIGATQGLIDRVVDFIERAWQRHSDLMAESSPYRQQLALVITAVLGLMSLHPSFAALAAALGALYVAAYQRRAEPAYERYPEPERRYSESDRKMGDDLRPRFHDRW